MTQFMKWWEQHQELAYGDARREYDRERRQQRQPVASREEQRGRYIDCGPAAWDDQ